MKKKQKYGKSYFYDMNTIIKFFNLKLLTQAEIKNINGDWHTIFLAQNKKNDFIYLYSHLQQIR